MPDSVVEEELSLLARVIKQLGPPDTGGERPDYDSMLTTLRDAIANARPEDQPPLVEQMYRVAALAQQHGRGREEYVDPRSPYFGHLQLSETARTRDILIGRTTYIDSHRGLRIVDWRNAPVSRLYYCYDEGDDYQETFGTRPLSGKVAARRAVTISEGELRRVSSPKGTHSLSPEGVWKEVSSQRSTLGGGQGTALRPNRTPKKRRKLGVGPDGLPREDKHLPEITALIDREQFELITRPDSGLVVIRGGAGSGKTTVGLHRIAFLGYRNPERYRPDRMIVVVYNEALKAYISEVLPSLGFSGVRTTTFKQWASSLRKRHLPRLPKRYSRETPLAVSRAKKHPALLGALTEVAKRQKAATGRAVVDAWAELLTDTSLLERHLGAAERRPLKPHEIETVIEWSVRQQRNIDESLEGKEEGWLDVEDDALLLHLNTLVKGPLLSSSRRPLSYEHVMVDEAQDLSPVELSVLLSACSSEASITLAGDSAQRLDLDSGFETWEDLFDDLGLDGLTISPLKIGYRSTAEIMELSSAVLGPLADREVATAPTRNGAPVELLRLSHDGEAVAVLARALRELATREPLSSVAVIARHAARADLFYRGLRRSEVPRLRRVSAQDFSFRPGVEVTDIRQVKGLEFDYVVLLDVDRATYPTTAESRHLLHIGITRAAHQLWLVCVGTPSTLLPDWLEA